MSFPLSERKEGQGSCVKGVKGTSYFRVLGRGGKKGKGGADLIFFFDLM